MMQWKKGTVVQDAVARGAVVQDVVHDTGRSGAGCGGMGGGGRSGTGCSGTGHSGAGCDGVWLGDIGAQPKIAMLQRALSHLLVTSINCQLFS